VLSPQLPRALALVCDHLLFHFIIFYSCSCLLRVQYHMSTLSAVAPGFAIAIASPLSIRIWCWRRLLYCLLCVFCFLFVKHHILDNYNDSVKPAKTSEFSGTTLAITSTFILVTTLFSVILLATKRRTVSGPLARRREESF
jgi:hypothetical protein